MLHKWKDEYKDYESKLAKELSDLINDCSVDLRANAEYFANFEHRYLQSKLMEFCLCYIEEMAKNGKGDLYDGRNEWACKIAIDLEKTKNSFTFTPHYNL